MNEVLSQQEIDTLLKALNAGELDPETIKQEDEKNRVKAYDFRRPIKLSKEYINTLHMIFENFSKIAGNLLTSQIRANAAFTLGAVEQISFDEFIRSTPNPTMLGVFHSKPLSGNQMLELNPQLCMQIIELMCGGAQSDFNKNISRKDFFTDIEVGILEEVISSLLKAFEAAWSEIAEIETIIDDIETNPQLIQNMSPNEPVILISFSVVILENKSFMNICIPYMSIENIMEKLSFKNWFDLDKSDSNENRELIEQSLVHSDVELKVELGRTIITIDDFLQLEEGDIIQLGIKTDSPLRMCVEDQFHYYVRPGEINGKLAVEVLQYVEEDVEQ